MKTDEDHYENVVGIDNDAEHGDADRDDSDTRILGNSIFFGCKLFCLPVLFPGVTTAQKLLPFVSYYTSRHVVTLLKIKL